MKSILDRIVGGGGSPERPRPTRDDEQFLRGLEDEERVTGFPPIVPGPVAKRLDGVYQRTRDPRFRVTSGTVEVEKS